MNNPETPIAFRYCARIFTAEEIDIIRELISSDKNLSRADLSRLVCDLLGWVRQDGRRKDMSCRVAMLRMEKDGLISLPPPRCGNGNGRHKPKLTKASDPKELISLPAGELGELFFKPVATPKDSSLYNELVERYHYLGYKPLTGAQMRYLVFGGDRLLAVLGLGAAAWKVAPRERFIGWDPDQRARNLHLVVNNSRFLILPWITSRNLASRILSGIARRLPQDWRQRYGYSPVLLETFVQQDRFQGTCYRASNWIHVGLTQGRGKLDRKFQRPLPVKHIFLYPLQRNFRLQLCSPQ
jgi:hypothetical protein